MTAVGNIIGPQFFRTKQAPHYQLGIGAMLCSFAVMGATGILYWVLILVENKERDRLYGKSGKDARERGLEVADLDETDGENKDFRYVY